MKTKIFMSSIASSIALAVMLAGCGSSSKAPSCDDSDVTDLVTQALTKGYKNKGWEIGKFTYKDFMTQDTIIPNPRKVTCYAQYDGSLSFKNSDGSTSTESYKDREVEYSAQYTDDGDKVYVWLGSGN